MALIGAIIGDIVGSQYEFPSMRPDDLDWEHCELFTDECEFTDDTVLSIATQYALDNNIRFEDAYRKFANIYPNRGYGDMFEQWLKTGVMQRSYGNGAAMRVSPLFDCFIGGNMHLDKIAIMAKDTTFQTHNHIEGTKGAVVTAISGYMAAHGASKNDIYEYVHSIYNDNDYPYPVSMPMNELRKNYKWSSTCQNTVPVAIRCFLDSENYESCIRNCLSLSCDMDTMCCIAGGIAESYYCGDTGFDSDVILQKYLDRSLYKYIKCSGVRKENV